MKQFGWLITLGLLGAVAMAGEKYAFVVGIDEYAPPYRLQCARVDVPAVVGLLRDSLGFPERNIKVLRDKEATSAAIRDGFREQLINKVRPGDLAVFYYSGHGSTRVDLDGDEEDGLDEMIVPIDFDPNKWDDMITDDHFGRWIKEIKTRNIVIILDCCHSGTGTKGFNAGGSDDLEKYYPGGWAPLEAKQEANRSRSVFQKGGAAGGKRGAGGGSDSKDIGEKNHILLAACAAEQKALGGTSGSSFTKALVKAIKEKPGITYEDLKTLVVPVVETYSKSQGKGMQTPQIEGLLKSTVFTAVGTPGRVGNTTVPSLIAPASTPPPPPPAATSRKPKPVERGKAWENSLGMKFVPVASTDVLFSIWETRVQDFQRFIGETRHEATFGVRSLESTPDGEGGAKFTLVEKEGRSWANPGFPQSQTHPVCAVSWEDAKAFCAWLTEKDRKEGLLGPTMSYRLPTDDEWSRAAGLPTEQGESPFHRNGAIKNYYPWGSQWPPPAGIANLGGRETGWGKNALSDYRDNFERTAPVGAHSLVQNGLYDLSGNVWEWCEDAFRKGSAERTLRGGSWGITTQGGAEASMRHHADAGFRFDNFGFRCVISFTASGVIEPVLPLSGPMTYRDFPLKVSVNKSQLRFDELATVSVESGEDCYIRLYHISAEGAVTQIYPNKFQRENKLKKGDKVVFPPAGSTFQFRITEPAGSEMIRAIASTEQFDDLKDFKEVEMKGVFMNVGQLSAAGTATKGMLVEAVPPPPALRPVVVATPPPPPPAPVQKIRMSSAYAVYQVTR